jgi:transposase
VDGGVDVELDVKGQHVIVHVHAGDGPFACPECATVVPGYDRKRCRWRHLPNILTYLRHRLTNADLEAVNATIQWVKKTARGFRNVEHFKTAIYFHCGGLDLYPH